MTAKSHPYSLNRPLVGHEPRVGRYQKGMTTIAPRRPVYGTQVRCQCGWSPGRNIMLNQAPSKGGRVAANKLYVEHITETLDAVAASMVIL